MHHPCESDSKLSDINGNKSGSAKSSIHGEDATDGGRGSTLSARTGTLAWLLALLLLVYLSAAAVGSNREGLTIVSVPSWIAEKYFQPHSHHEPAVSVVR